MHNARDMIEMLYERLHFLWCVHLFALDLKLLETPHNWLKMLRFLCDLCSSKAEARPSKRRDCNKESQRPHRKRDNNTTLTHRTRTNSRIEQKQLEHNTQLEYTPHSHHTQACNSDLSGTLLLPFCLLPLLLFGLHSPLVLSLCSLPLSRHVHLHW